MPKRPVAVAMTTCAIAWAIASPAPAADPAPTCQASKNKLAGDYALCRQKAEAAYAFHGALEPRPPALQRCADTFTRKWPLTEAKAASAGSACPSVGDLNAVAGVVAAHTTSVAVALGGGAAGSPVTFPATGQVRCWDAITWDEVPCAGTGHDGDTQAGGALAYVDNGDGTITDVNTGLMWEKLADDGGVHDVDAIYSWNDAFAKAAALNAAAFAGHADWRVPNVKELLSIVNYDVDEEDPTLLVSAAFDTNCSPGCSVTSCSCTSRDVYWSSTTAPDERADAFFVRFDTDGASYSLSKPDPYAVRLVRGSASAEPPRADDRAGRTCQSSKNKEAGKYAACRQKAEAKFALDGNAAARSGALDMCRARYDAKWPRLEARAAAAGSACPSVGDQGAIASAVDAHTTNVATALAGGTLQVPVMRAFPATGQQTCWDEDGNAIPCAGTGHDGGLRAGGTLACVDNGDGTVTDTNTGLVWEKLSDDGSIHDKDDRYVWDDAYAKIAALNAAMFAGHGDWRLPNVKELHSIVDYGVASPGPMVAPAFDTGCTPGCTVTSCSCTRSGTSDFDGAYWSSTTWAAVPDSKNFVDFGIGQVYQEYMLADFGVRAVRSGS